MTFKKNKLTGESTLRTEHGVGRRQFLASGSWCVASKLIGLGAIAATHQLTAADSAPVSVDYEPAFQSWTLQNEVFQAVLRLNATTGVLQLDELRNRVTNEVWRLPAGGGSFPLVVELEGGRRLSSETGFLLTAQAVAEIDRGGRSLTLELSEQDGPLRLSIEFSVYPGQPVLRHQATIANRLGQPLMVRKVNFLAWEFADEAARYDTYEIGRAHV